MDVQPYAFTTKSLFVGHMDYKYLRWQVRAGARGLFAWTLISAAAPVQGTTGHRDHPCGPLM